MKFSFIIFCLLILSGISVTANESNSTDETETGYRKFNEESLEKYLSEKDFFYLENKKAKTNYLDKAKRWFYTMLRSIIGSRATGIVLGNFHYILMAIALFLIVYKISGLSLEKMGYRVKKVNYFKPDLLLPYRRFIFNLL